MVDSILKLHEKIGDFWEEKTKKPVKILANILIFISVLSIIMAQFLSTITKHEKTDTLFAIIALTLVAILNAILNTMFSGEYDIATVVAYVFIWVFVLVASIFRFIDFLALGKIYALINFFIFLGMTIFLSAELINSQHEKFIEEKPNKKPKKSK